MTYILILFWRDGRVVHGVGLENRYNFLNYRGFESLSLLLSFLKEINSIQVKKVIKNFNTFSYLFSW